VVPFLLEFESPQCESIKSEMKVSWQQSITRVSYDLTFYWSDVLYRIALVIGIDKLVLHESIDLNNLIRTGLNQEYSILSFL